ncbi:hypothetical protein BD770DRAFT_243136 [Pilaira anomala]|nr:hypothetical protein BD770DRAFT_243136 [Pilaira anomala]
MGQDQSSPSGSKRAPSLTPSSSSTSHSRNILPNKVFVHPPPQEEQEDLESSGISEEEGIIQVVIGPEEEEEEEELRLLRSIKRFEPFIKEQDNKGFHLEHLLGIKQSKLLNVKENDVSLPSSVELFFDLQTHIRENMIRLNNEQRILLRRIAYVDELSTSSFQIVSNAFNQAKTASDRLSEV